MTTFETQQLLGWIGHPAVDDGGRPLGVVDAIYEDDSGSGPEWFAIDTRDVGTGDASGVIFVPVRGSTADGDNLRVPYSAAHIRRAPIAGADAHLSPEQVDLLYRHYGMDWAYERLAAAQPEGGTALDATADGDALSVTRSEEELQVTTREREVGRAHLRKWVETELVQVTVPVRREYARLVTEPADPDATGGEFAEWSEGEVVLLREEEVVVDKRVVAKENVRVEVETVVDERVVSEEVRKERVAVEGDVDPR